MSALLEIIAFFVDHGVWVAAGSALAVGVAMLASMPLSRQTLRRFTQHTASTTPPSRLSASTVPTPTSDPMELLRSFSRARGSYVVLLGSPSSEREDEAAASNGGEIIPIEAFLQSYRHIPKDRPIDLVLSRSVNAPISWVRRFARILDAHPAKVTAIIPFRVLGPIGLLAFAADEIMMSEDARIVPDMGDIGPTLAALAKKKRRHMSSEFLLKLFSTEQKVRETEWLAGLLLRSRRARRWRQLARKISRGTFNAISPLRVQDLRAWGLQVRSDGLLDSLALSDAAVTILASNQDKPTKAIRVAPTCADTCPIGDVRDAMMTMEQQRGTRVISIIHDGGMNEKSLGAGTTAEALKAIRAVPAGTNIDIILHTPGGHALGAAQIVQALKAHKGKKTFFVPYHAFSAGTILALTGNEIFMSEVASLGPIDVQFGDTAAAAFESLLQHKRPKDIEDELLMWAMHSKRTIQQCHENALATMKGTYSSFRAERIARSLNKGYLSHGFPLMYQEARMIGLHVRLGVPNEAFTIVESLLTSGNGFCSVIHCPD